MHNQAGRKAPWLLLILSPFLVLIQNEFHVNQQPVHTRGEERGSKNPKIWRTFFMDAPKPQGRKEGRKVERECL